MTDDKIPASVALAPLSPGTGATGMSVEYEQVILPDIPVDRGMMTVCWSTTGLTVLIDGQLVAVVNGGHEPAGGATGMSDTLTKLREIAEAALHDQRRHPRSYEGDSPHSNGSPWLLGPQKRRQIRVNAVDVIALLDIIEGLVRDLSPDDGWECGVCHELPEGSCNICAALTTAREKLKELGP